MHIKQINNKKGLAPQEALRATVHFLSFYTLFLSNHLPELFALKIRAITEPNFRSRRQKGKPGFARGPL